MAVPTFPIRFLDGPIMACPYEARRLTFRPEQKPQDYHLPEGFRNMCCIIGNYANSWSWTILRMTASFASGSPLLTEVDIARTDEGRARRSNKGVLR
jgi:hypothetical protein